MTDKKHPIDQIVDNTSDTLNILDDMENILDDAVARIARIESRIVQLMLHMGVTPHGIQDPKTRATTMRSAA